MDGPNSNLRRIALGSAALLLLALAMLSTYAATGPLDRTARDETRDADERVRIARFAVWLQPFSEQAETTLAVAEARGLLDAGEIKAAYELLLPLSTTVRGDELFRDTYQEAVRRKWPIDARKAHQQHAREARDGSLDPDDVER